MKQQNDTPTIDPATELSHVNSETNKILMGVPVSSGVAIGQSIVIERLDSEIYPKRILVKEEVPGELERFARAVETAEEQLQQIKTMVQPGTPLDDHMYILDTHLLLLKDRMFYEGTKSCIDQEMQNAEWALSETIERITSAFDSIQDEYLRERARDIYFAGERVLRILMGRTEDKKIHQLPPNSILVTHDLSPADTAQVQKENVLGFAIDMGGRTSHTAIMARSLKIPAVAGLERISQAVQTGDTIILDGGTGVVIINPDPETMMRYRERQDVYNTYQESLMGFGRLPAVTADGGHSVRIMANVEFVDEIEIAREHGSEGIGLFRTEYLFLGRRDLPSEEEQYEVYRDVLLQNAAAPVTIRTLDVGADKISSNLGLAKESNPALGLRAIRLCLSRQELFHTQLRAILRASSHGECRLLLPMIACISELQEALHLIQKAKDSLAEDGIPFNDCIKIGVLVEVPSAVAISDIIARQADFMSIGTNDLIQYSLAIDRVNEQVNYLYDTLHPAILRMIRQVTTTGQDRGIHVAMCGEMAGDPVSVPILIGLGLDELSMNALSIPMVKKLIRSINLDECKELTHRAFQMQDSREIRGFLENWISNRFPDDYFVGQPNNNHDRQRRS